MECDRQWASRRGTAGNFLELTETSGGKFGNQGSQQELFRGFILFDKNLLLWFYRQQGAESRKPKAESECTVTYPRVPVSLYYFLINFRLTY